MRGNRLLAIDMGATSVRGILGWIEDGKLMTEEVCRFSHEPIQISNDLYWNFSDMIMKIEDTVQRYSREICSIGVDGWGVDFGVLDSYGILINPPHCYRDPANAAAHTEFRRRMSDDEVFSETGIQVMDINTIYQLYRLKKSEKKKYDGAKYILMFSDLVCYYLTGEMHSDLSMLSTSSLYNTGTHQFSRKIMDLIDISESMFPEVIPWGVKRGTTANARIASLRDLGIPVCSVLGHDTASAVLMTSAMEDPDTLFLSCGTWSLLGAVQPKAALTKQAREADFTNELTIGGKCLFLKNITGLYLFEKYKKQMEKRYGKKISYDEIAGRVSMPGGTDAVIDMDSPVFAQDEFDARKEIRTALEKQGEVPPEDDSLYFRIIYNSLVEKYRETVENLSKITGRSYKTLQIIGGGSKSGYLCQRIADALNVTVIAGPMEATALGNLALQMSTNHMAGSVKEAVSLAAQTETRKVYLPGSKKKESR